MTAPHAMVRFYTPDEMAESLDGISLPLSGRLWGLMEEMEETKPLGGDGTDGTVEWPEPTEEKHSVLMVWGRLTEEERVEINEALDAHDAWLGGVS